MGGSREVGEGGGVGRAGRRGGEGGVVAALTPGANRMFGHGRWVGGWLGAAAREVPGGCGSDVAAGVGSEPPCTHAGDAGQYTVPVLCCRGMGGVRRQYGARRVPGAGPPGPGGASPPRGGDYR